MSDGPHPLRQALWPLGLCYGVVAALRNAAFATGLKRVERAPVPVLSIGNLTVGGTGKTPTVTWLCERLCARGERPGVLARGYGRAPGARLNDEGEMLQRRLPWLLQEQDPDRVAGAQRLAAQGATTIVLDDGFQHRRLHRDLDLVCLDAELPFGNGQCLPAGDLREWPSGLRRASLVLLTRAGRLTTTQRDARVDRIRRLANDAALPVFACEHGPLDAIARVRGTAGGEVLRLADLAGLRAVLLTAVARPDSVRRTAENLGVEVVEELRFRDHHRFTGAELATAEATAARHGARLLTTEKDDARIDANGPDRLVLRIGLTFLDGEPTDQHLGWA